MEKLDGDDAHLRLLVRRVGFREGDDAVLVVRCDRATVAGEHDDDHVLAIFQIEGGWGAVAKSNFVGLRYREPVYRNLRELVMSYFETYFNLARERTLRAHTVPLNLARFDRRGWTTRDETIEDIATRLDQIRKRELLKPGMAERMTLLDPRSFEAGLLGALPEGLRKVE